jgi:hypothetical protein
MRRRKMRKQLIGVQYLGVGGCVLCTYYTSDPAALADVESDPAHVRGVYEYSPDDGGGWYSTPGQAARAVALSRRPRTEG